MAEKILMKLKLSKDEKKSILIKYLELQKKNIEIKERIKRILGEEKNKTVKYLGGTEFLPISSWEYTYVFYIIDLVPQDIKMDVERTIEFIGDESRLGVKRVSEILKTLEDFELIEINEAINKLYNRFLFRGREYELAMDDIRTSFINSSLFLSGTGASSLRPAKKKGTRLEKSNPLATQMNLLNWDFFLVGKNTAFVIEKLIENLYDDIQKVCQEDQLGDEPTVYCMSSQFFDMKTRIDR